MELLAATNDGVGTATSSVPKVENQSLTFKHNDGVHHCALILVPLNTFFLSRLPRYFTVTVTFAVSPLLAYAVFGWVVIFSGVEI